MDSNKHLKRAFKPWPLCQTTAGAVEHTSLVLSDGTVPAVSLYKFKVCSLYLITGNQISTQPLQSTPFCPNVACAKIRHSLYMIFPIM